MGLGLGGGGRWIVLVTHVIGEFEERIIKVLAQCGIGNDFIEGKTHA